MSTTIYVFHVEIRKGEAILMSTHNVCFHGEINYISIERLLMTLHTKSYLSCWRHPGIFSHRI